MHLLHCKISSKNHSETCILNKKEIRSTDSYYTFIDSNILYWYISFIYNKLFIENINLLNLLL